MKESLIQQHPLIDKEEFKKAFLTLMKEETLQLPKRGGKEYISSLEEVFDFYLANICCISEAGKYALKNICDKIIEITKLSNPDLAYDKFEKLMAIYLEHGTLHIFKDTLPVDGYGVSNVNLFRVRQDTDNRVFSRQEIFHQPINRYRNIHAYRYNVAAVPSLYLSATVQCCLKELNTKMKSGLIASLYRLDHAHCLPLYVIDLGVRPLDFVRNKNHYVQGYSYYKYLFAYPLIAACSFVVSNKNGTTIPEYTLTNLLLRWLVQHHDQELCGIRYFSCHNATYIMDEGKGSKKEKDATISYTRRFINYVFPIEQTIEKDANISNKLNTCFKVNKPKLSIDHVNIQDFETQIKRDIASLAKVEEIKELETIKNN